jgi:hypothetical protein
MADVLIIMGSDSDLKVMSEAAKFLDEVKVSYDLTVVSAHRTPDRMYNFAKEAKNKGYKTYYSWCRRCSPSAGNGSFAYVSSRNWSSYPIKNNEWN